MTVKLIRRFGFVSRVLSVAVLTAAVLLFAAEKAAASPGGVTVTPNTNDVVGLKSNDPTNAAYPNLFPLGARVCNNTASAITGVNASLTWGTATGAGATNINTQGPTSIDLGSLAAGSCIDAYYSVLITRASASFDSTREYTITVTSSAATATTPAHRRIYVERLIAQNRNSTRKIAGPGGCNTDYTICDPAPTNLIVGNTYTYKLYGDTSTSQNTVEAFLDFPGTIFRVLNASSTASLVTGSAQASVPGVYNDACTLQWDYTLANYKECVGTGGAGGNYAMSYSVKIISAGSGTLKAVIYDGSSGNWHLNSDYGSAGFTSNYVARWPLDVSVTGQGDVVSNVAGVNCGISAADCEGAYDNGTVVTLSAYNGEGETFLGWTGACSGTGTCVVTMSQARSVHAIFTGQSNYPLSVAVTGLGSVSSLDTTISSCAASSGVCDHSYSPGSEVTLVATPSTGQTFTGWTGDGCSGISTSCTLTMDQARAVSATFASSVSNSYNLSVAASGPGLVTSSPSGISCGATCSADYASGASVTLTATPSGSAAFTGWGGACSGTGSCVVTMDQVRYVTAGFAAPVTLTVAKSGSGSGTISSSPAGISCGATCAYDFPGGSSVTLSASPDGESTFEGWSGGGCSGTGDCVVSLSDAATVTASFSTAYGLTVTKTGGGDGYVASNPDGIACGISCFGAFAADSLVTLSAEPDVLSNFAGWSGAGAEECSGSLCSVSMSAARNITAVFTPKNVLTVSLAGTVGAGSVYSFDGGIDCGENCAYGYGDGETVTLLANPVPGATFDGWTGACSGTGACLILMESAADVTAHFTGNYELTVQSTGNGTGTIASSPGEMSCANCNGFFPDGSTVTLTATPDEGSVFTGWSGGGCSGTDTCEVSMTSAQEVFANFEFAPVNDTRPELFGTARDGETLSASGGGWAGSPVVTFVWQWQLCDADGNDCVDIEGVEGDLTLTSDYIGHTVRMAVTATNDYGSATAYSDPSEVITAAPPENVVSPEIAGEPVEDEVLTAGIGTWTGTEPLTYSYQWMRCDADGADCVDIEEATGNTYTVTPGDSGFTIVLAVTATNDAGSATAFSPPTELAQFAKPVNEEDPVASGPAVVGETVTTTDGVWNSSGPLTFQYRWHRCDESYCYLIDGAQDKDYVVTEEDIGYSLEATVFATNSGGTDRKNASPLLGPVAPRDPVNWADPTIVGTPALGETLTTSEGEWSSPSEMTFSYQWLRCDVYGGACEPIDGATNRTYNPAGPDVGHTLRVSVTGTNATGQTTKDTEQVGPIEGLAPTNDLEPSISGTPADGQTLTLDPGEWTSYEEPTYAQQWQRCDVDGNDCVDIERATDLTLLLGPGDVGFTFKAIVTVTNATGSLSKETNLIGPVAGAPLALTVSSSDVTTDGATLTGTVDPRFADSDYHFEFGPTTDYGTTDGAGTVLWAGGSGASTVTAQLTGLEPATTYHFRIAAENSVGSAAGDDMQFTTAALPPAPAPPATPTAGFAADANPQGQPQERVRFDMKLPGAGKGTVTGRVKYDRAYNGPRGHGHAGKQRSFVAFRQPFTANVSGDVPYTAKLNRPALEIIRRRGFLRVAVAVRFLPSDGSAARTLHKVLRLRPFTISSGNAAGSSHTTSATVRIPRRGSLRVKFLLRDKASGKSVVFKRFVRRSLRGGSYSFSLPLPDNVRKQLGAGKASLMVKADFRSKRYPALMWRTRAVTCGDCGN